MGIYTGDVFILFATAPTLECDTDINNAETCDVNFNFGGYQVTETLTGGYNLLKKYTNIPTGLSASQFTMSYTNIYGTAINCNGTMSTISNHYL